MTKPDLETLPLPVTATRSEMATRIVARLLSEFARLQHDWRNPGMITSTRHCVIDDLLPDATALEIHRAFPRDADGFVNWDSFRQRKRSSYDIDRHPRMLAEIVYALQSAEVLETVSRLTGLPGLDPDPHLYASGLAMMFRGDFLNPHLDNSHERSRTKYRRLNLLYYVTPGWTPESGGDLELWDSRVRKRVPIPALFNRLVLMETTPQSWHSVSAVAAEGPRCCVSSFYFSERPAAEKPYRHLTTYTGRPEQPIRRAVCALDNVARTVARKLGARRATDAGYDGGLAAASDR